MSHETEPRDVAQAASRFSALSWLKTNRGVSAQIRVNRQDHALHILLKPTRKGERVPKNGLILVNKFSIVYLVDKEAQYNDIYPAISGQSCRTVQQQQSPPRSTVSITASLSKPIKRRQKNKSSAASNTQRNCSHKPSHATTMPKRKRGIETSLPARLEKFQEELSRALKAAKGFERQRLSKRQRDRKLPPEKRERVAREITVLKVFHT